LQIAADQCTTRSLALALASSTPYVRVVVDCGFPLVVALTPRSVRELALVPGVNVMAVFKASAAHLIRYR
jgi:molybdopterin-binding protein